TAGEYARRPAFALPPGPSGLDVSPDRSRAAVARRMRAAPGRGREDSAGARPGRHHVNALQRDSRGRASLMADKPVPTPTHETRPYWEGCKQHELRVQRCAA